MAIIDIKNITKDYGAGRGNFGIDLTIEQGEVLGFVGTNGAGKTTLIRQMMGFLRPNSGTVTIKGLNAWKDAAEVKHHVGYLPGEIAFPDAPTGSVFLQRQAALLGVTDMTYANQIIQMLQLDPTANLKRMSKGMKQKTAIAAAFMGDKEILILDEPTTGLDPLMRRGFTQLLNTEREKGKTIFMSTHMFEEVEDTCDRVAVIKDGKIIAIKSLVEIRRIQDKVYKVEFTSPAHYTQFLTERFELTERYEEKQQAFVKVNDADINHFMATLRNYEIKYISEIKYSLEQYFKNLY